MHVKTNCVLLSSTYNSCIIYSNTCSDVLTSYIVMLTTVDDTKAT